MREERLKMLTDAWKTNNQWVGSITLQEDTFTHPSVFFGGPVSPYKITKVIFNPPATIVFGKIKQKQ